MLWALNLLRSTVPRKAWQDDGFCRSTFTNITTVRREIVIRYCFMHKLKGRYYSGTANGRRTKNDIWKIGSDLLLMNIVTVAN
jgi:hypothetical protein